MEIDYTHKEEDRQKILEIMTEEQLQSFFRLMQVMFVESFLGFESPVENSTENKNQDESVETIVNFSQDEKEDVA